MRRHRRKERARHPEDHRVRVDEEEAENHRLPAHVTEAGDNRAPARAIGILDRDQTRQQGHRDDRPDVRERVAEVEPLQIEELDQHARERGTSTAPNCEVTLFSAEADMKCASSTSCGVIERWAPTPMLNEAEITNWKT